MPYEWKNVNSLFDEINQKCNYIILRNYEELDDDNFYCSGHADIDFLTDNVNEFVSTLKAYPRFLTDDKIHYLVKINGVEVVIDVRSVGDDYYCKDWEKNMLSQKIKVRNWYVNNDENYYYSLIYHAILQKKQYAKDYQVRLNNMAKNLGLNGNDLDSHISNLINYMRNKNYFFTYPDDIWVPLRVEYIPKNMIRKEYKLKVRKIKNVIINILIKIKRMFVK